MTDSHDQLSPEDEETIRRVFAAHPPLVLGDNWEAVLSAAFEIANDRDDNDLDQTTRSTRVPRRLMAALVEEASASDEAMNDPAYRVPRLGRHLPRHRPVGRLLAQAAILAALVAGAVAVVRQQVETTGLEAGSDSASSIGVPVPGLDPSDRYITYVDVHDDSGSIQMSVPEEWAAEVLTAPGVNGLPMLAAAPRLENGLFDSLTGPGVFVTVFPERRQPRVILDEARDSPESIFGQCDSPVSQQFVTPYRGQLEVFVNCGSSRTTIVQVALDADDEMSALLTLQAPAPRDLDALSTIVGSLVLTRSF